MDEFTFGDGWSDDNPADVKAENSKFFGHYSNSDDDDVISPSIAKMKEKEMIWEKSVENSLNQDKKKLSPGSQEKLRQTKRNCHSKLLERFRD